MNPIFTTIDEKTTSLVFYNNPYTKIKFVNEIINSYKIPILYVDFDLLFSGYYESGLIAKIPNICIFHPNEENYLEIISEVNKKATLETTIIILDSLNGLYNTLNKIPNPGRLVNSLIMFMSYNIRFSNSKLIIPSLSEKKENQWVLTPTKRHILETENMNRFHIEENSSKLQFQIL